ncbi:MAG: DNA polymerase I, partial [Lachnospiraceae bacterium]|nr:DNA polymerase I [Lachnospiraceae bacterium]
LSSSNFMQRSFGERVAMNSPIQGTAADIIKIAMINVERKLEEKNMRTRIVLQVHDELLLEAPEDEIEEASKLLREEMTHAVSLTVSMDVSVEQGSNWYEAK